MKLSDLKAKLGYGTYGAGGAYKSAIDADALYEIILTAYRHGVQLIDTAAAYGSSFGQSERDLGVVLKRLIEKGTCVRENLYISTKCGIRVTDQGYQVTNSDEEITTSCQDSLERLQTDYIDLFYLHRYEPPKDDQDPQIHMDRIAATLSTLIDKGKIREVGLSEANEETIQMFAAAMAKYNKKHCFVAVQSEYSLVNPHVGECLMPVCDELNLIFFAYSPLAKGFLTDNALSNPSSVFNPAHSIFADQLLEQHKEVNVGLLAKIQVIAKQIPCTISQLALAWLIEQPRVIPLISTSQEKNFIEAVQAQSIHLSKDINDQLDELPAIKGSRRSQILRDLGQKQMDRYSPTP